MDLHRFPRPTRIELGAYVAAKLRFSQERPSGSNIMTNVCLTEAQLREQVEAARRFQNDRSQQGRRCTSGPGCSN